ncbi:MAG: hypothetical protein ACRDTF_04750, partial [Pseudonocardiaceae bacterium]
MALVLGVDERGRNQHAGLMIFNISPWAAIRSRTAVLEAQKPSFGAEWLSGWLLGYLFRCTILK